MDEDIYIAGLHDGNGNIFREVFEKYHTRLCYFASTLLTTDVAAEDVVQEAFVKLWQKRTHFNDMKAVQAFLYITIKNHCLNIYKHDKVVRKYGDLLHVEIDEGDAINRIMESEVLENVYQALQRLPAGCRKIMRLSYFEGLKNKEIATQLHVSINTVKTQKKRGLNLLRAILKVTSIFL